MTIHKSKTNRWKKIAIASATTALIVTSTPITLPTVAQAADSAQIKQLLHTIQSGDTLYLIGKRYGVSAQQLMAWNRLKTAWIYPNQYLFIVETYTYTVQSGDSLWKISQKTGVATNVIQSGNNLSSDLIFPGHLLNIPKSSTTSATRTSSSSTQPWIEYVTHTVQQGETGWTIALDYGIPFEELLEVNGLHESSLLMPGNKLKVPVHHIPVQPTVSAAHGEYLDWWEEARYVWPIGTVAVITDFYTGRSWKAKRTVGASHADVEPLTADDTRIMKEVWGGEWSWVRRPVLVSVNGHRIAASVSGMPHDIDNIKENNFPGHFDVHFANSRRHKDNLIDPEHQKNVSIAAGRN